MNPKVIGREVNLIERGLGFPSFKDNHLALHEPRAQREDGSSIFLRLETEMEIVFSPIYGNDLTFGFPGFGKYSKDFVSVGGFVGDETTTY